ncbi:hypothetical protein HYW32_01065 [Candidatus Berkelbacteria bacterium]|nr:hypothetical protein [Candidatus Berkelbacteria bacterium]
MSDEDFRNLIDSIHTKCWELSEPDICAHDKIGAVVKDVEGKLKAFFRIRRELARLQRAKLLGMLEISIELLNQRPGRRGENIERLKTSMIALRANLRSA